MTILEQVKSLVKKMLGLQKLSDNPKSSRYTFINSEETIKKQATEEYRIWYVGDSDELQNYYTNRDLSGNAKEPIYNRNKPNYFWGIAVKGNEKPIKKVHSGVPKAIVDTISNVIGMPEISIEDEATNNRLQRIIKKNNFSHKLTQEARPLTCVEGWGAWKVIFNKGISDTPILQYYEGLDCEFVVRSGILIGIIYKDYYKYKDKDYVLFETHSIDEEGSKIEYNLFRLYSDQSIEPVELNVIEELAHLENKIIKGYKKVLGVACKYFYDVFNKDYGRSIFQGKVDVFDDIDQCLSQASQTDRVSTPVEYYPVDILPRDKFGNTQLPNVYNRQFIEIPSYPDGDGRATGKLETSQPSLNFGQYIERYNSLINVALIGILSPASMGIDVAKKDNAEAQREKEKTTIFTRNNIMESETIEIKELFNIALDLEEYMNTGVISLVDKDISVKYSEFANPSFESLSQVLTPMFNSGAISTEMYVERLYGDALSEEEKAKEIERLNANKQADNFNIDELGLDINGNE